MSPPCFKGSWNPSFLCLRKLISFGVFGGFFEAVAMCKKWTDFCETSLLRGTNTAQSLLSTKFIPSIWDFWDQALWDQKLVCFFPATLSVGLIRYITSSSQMLPSHSCNYRDLKLLWKELHDCVWCFNKRWPKLFTAGEKGPVLPSIPWAEMSDLNKGSLDSPGYIFKWCHAEKQ